jgi:peptidoglycan/xylan/chitin deacetylase (PgdA/CDA1 family)
MPLSVSSNNLYNILTRLKIDSLLRFMNRRKCAVLMYHGVVPDDCPIDAWTLVKESEFRKQLDVLAQYYEVVPISQIKERFRRSPHIHRPLAAITFDDGYRNNYLTALPILKEYGFASTIFICSWLLNNQDMTWYDKVIYAIQCSACDQIDVDAKRYDFSHAEKSKRWDSIQTLLVYLKTKSEIDRLEIVDHIFSKLDPTLAHTKYLTLLSHEEVKALHESGLVTIGAHTANHEILTNIPLNHAAETIQINLDDLGSLTGQKVRFFSYPNGDYNPEIVKILRSTSITAAFTTVKDLYFERYDDFEIPRIGIGGYDDINLFLLKSSGIERVRSSMHL